MRWLDGITNLMDMSEHTPGVGDRQGSLACYSPWSHKELDRTEMLTLWKESYNQPRQHIEKQRHHFVEKHPCSQFSCSVVSDSLQPHGLQHSRPPCPTLCNPMDCILPGSFSHRVIPAGILEWVAFSFSKGFS